MTVVLPAPYPSGIHSIRFYQSYVSNSDTLTANFVDHQWLFYEPAVITGEQPSLTPAPNAVNLGPFTGNPSHWPLATTTALTINWEESQVAKTATLTPPSTIGGANAANLSAAYINVATGALSLTFATNHAPDTGSVSVNYTLYPIQAWSKGIRITSYSSGYVEFSFDGVNVHGRVEGGNVEECLDRYEGGIAVRGSGNYIVEAW